MALQLAGVGVICRFAGRGSADGGGEGLVVHDVGGSGAEGSDTVATCTERRHRWCPHRVVYDLCIIRFFRTYNRVDCYTLLDMRSAAEGVRVDDVLHEGIEGGDTRHGDGEVPHRTFGVGGLDKVSHVTTHTPGPAVSRVTTGILNYYFEWY